jgi:type VI secretion system ImpC/EvpB family protein
MKTITKTEAQPTVANRLKELGVSLAPATLTPIETYSDRKLKPHAVAVAQVVQAATQESENFGSQTFDEFMAAVKAGLWERVNAMKSAILAHPDYRNLERAHATVEEQVFQQDGKGLRVRVLNLTMADIRKDFAEAGTVERSHVYDSLVSGEYHRPGGQPNRVVHLTHPVGPDDVDVIEPLLTMADEAHFALATEAKPEVICPSDGAEAPADFRGLPRTAAALGGEYRKLENAPLHGLQQKPIATKWLFAVGQTIGRRAYDPKTNAAPTAPMFRESNGPLYLPVSLLAAKSIARSYTRNVNGSRIAGVLDGGKHTRPSVIQDGEVMTLDCVINEKQEYEMHQCGLYCVLPWKRKDYAVAFDVPSAFVPVPTGDPQADADARLASRLNYVMLSIELGHRLKKALRYARGSTQDADTMAALIESELKLLVTPDAKSATQEVLARKPLASVKVTVTSPLPGVFIANANITPHTLMSEAHVTLTLKAEISAAKQ